MGGLCLLYTSDAADERSSVDLGGRRIIKEKKETLKKVEEGVHITALSTTPGISQPPGKRADARSAHTHSP